MRTPGAQRGVTLLELVIAMAVSAIVLVGILGVVNTQQKAYFDGHRQRAAQGSARAALTFMEQQLLLAGFGLDAPLTFDFDRYAGPCTAEMAGCPRDATNNSDELVFYNRNPHYGVGELHTATPAGSAWRLLAVLPDRFQLVAREGDVFLKGQILQAVCATGNLYAYGTVEDTVALADDGTPPVTTAPVDVILTAPVADDPYQRQDDAVDPCFFSGEGRVFLVERHRFHVRPVLEDGVYHPYLVHDRGIDVNRDGTLDERDEEVLAEGIEVLQFGYVMTNAALVPRGTVAGTAIGMARGSPGSTSGDDLTLLDFPGVFVAPSLYKATSFYPYAVGPPPHDRRLTDHQANVRAVQIALIARSPEPDRTVVGGGAFALPVLNLDVRPAWINDTDRYARVRFDTTVPLRNMVVRAMTDF